MDNHHVQMYPTQMSCGVAQLSGISSDINKVLYAIATNLYHPSKGSPYGAIQWSDLADSNGAQLYAVVGHTFKLPPERLNYSSYFDNPKTGNRITIFTWIPDHVEFKKWYVEERVRRAKSL